MSLPSPTPPDLLEQAHLALLRGHLDEARAFLERLVIAEPNNTAAEDLRASVIARQAARDETARLQQMDWPNTTPQAQTGSIWTRPLQDPTSALLNSPAARKWPKPLLLIACLLAGMVSMLLPFRHHHSHIHSRIVVDIGFGLALGLTVFISMLVRKR